MNATLFVLPGSNSAMAARLMFEAKGVPYRRVDLVPILAKVILRAAGFERTTVPALKIDGRRLQGTGVIARVLDEISPLAPLVPTEPEQRAEVEAAERWGDEILQAIPRRIIWNVLNRDRRAGRSYLEGAKLGLPIAVASKTAPPIAAMARRIYKADDDAVRRDLAALPATVAEVDRLLAEGVIGNQPLNVADYQIATSVRLLLTMDDARPYFDGHPAADYALRTVPEYPGYAPAALPVEWKPPVPAPPE